MLVLIILANYMLRVNMDAGRPEKSGACWRDQTEDKGFAGRLAPTWTLVGLENPGRVGVTRRKTKALRGGRRQHAYAHQSVFLFSIRLLRLRAKLTRLRAAFATSVALLLFCPAVAMLHPLHSPRSRGGTPVPLFPLQNYLRSCGAR